jgi:electron transfer flavoprotein alpha subunit
MVRYGVDAAYVADHPDLEHFRTEPYACVFEDFINLVRPSAVLVGATSLGRALAPRIAARFRTGLTADCTSLEMNKNTDLVQIRPAFGGNIMARIMTPRHRPQFCTVRYRIFSASQPLNHPSGVVIRMNMDEGRLATSTKIIDISQKPKEIDISEAETIVAVGRGIKSRADLAMVRELAALLNARTACTRPLIEAGWFDPRCQIGLSGRTVKPRLIITAGISGSVQFAAGMNHSDCIMAINQDRRAPIFDIAHYGFIGDLYDILPALIKRVNEYAIQKD